MSAFSELHRPVSGNKIFKGHSLSKLQQAHNQRVPFVPNALNVRSVEKVQWENKKTTVKAKQQITSFM